MKRKIFAALVAVVMVISMLPMSVMADDAVVYYSVDTAEELVAAINDGKEYIDLTQNITLSNKITIPAGKNVAIKSENGATITANDVVDAFEVDAGADLALCDGITVVSNTSILYANGGDIYVDGATLSTANSLYCAVFVEKGGSFVMKDGLVAQSGTDRVTISVTGAGSTVTISGGEVTSADSSVIASSNGAAVTISGGNVKTTCTNGVIASGAYAENGGTITVTGGTVKTPATVASGYGLVATAGGKVVVNGGNVIGGVKAWNSSESSVTVNGGNVVGDVVADNGAQVDVYGGSIDGNVDENLLASIKVSFNANGGEFDAAAEDVVITASKPCPTLPAVTREGYTFHGWWIVYTVDGKTQSMFIATNYILNLKADMFENAEAIPTFTAIASWTKDQPKPEPKFDTPIFPNLRSIVIDTTEGGKTGVKSGRAYGALGSTYRLTLTPDEGYEIGEVLVNGKAVEVNKNNKISFVVKGNTYVEVEFVEIED